MHRWSGRRSLNEGMLACVDRSRESTRKRRSCPSALEPESSALGGPGAFCAFHGLRGLKSDHCPFILLPFSFHPRMFPLVWWNMVEPPEGSDSYGGCPDYRCSSIHLFGARGVAGGLVRRRRIRRIKQSTLQRRARALGECTKLSELSPYRKSVCLFVFFRLMSPARILRESHISPTTYASCTQEDHRDSHHKCLPYQRYDCPQSSESSVAPESEQGSKRSVVGSGRGEGWQVGQSAVSRSAVGDQRRRSVDRDRQYRSAVGAEKHSAKEGSWQRIGGRRM